MARIRSRPLLAVAAGVAVAIAVTPASTSGGPGLAPGGLLVSTGGQDVHAELGTYCVEGEPQDGQVRGVCSDAAWPHQPPRPRLDVWAGQRLHLRFFDRPRVADEIDHLSARLERLDGRRQGIGRRARLDVEPSGSRHRRWSLSVPSALGRANAIHVQTTLVPSGDASYLVGLHQRRRYCPRGDRDGLLVDRLVGRRLARAERVAQSNGCELRVIRRDGEPLAVTDDLRPDRINVAIEDERIARVRGIY